jgi:hypothetical protein
VSAQQAQGPEFKPYHHKKIKVESKQPFPLKSVTLLKKKPKKVSLLKNQCQGQLPQRWRTLQAWVWGREAPWERRRKIPVFEVGPGLASRRPFALSAPTMHLFRDGAGMHTLHGLSPMDPHNDPIVTPFYQ